MFSLKRYDSLHCKNLTGYIHDNFMKQTARCLNIQVVCPINDKKNKKTYLHTVLQFNKYKYNRRDYSNIQTKICSSYMSTYCKRFCTHTSLKDHNKFGDISFEKYERVPMDETEEKEEKISNYEKFPNEERIQLQEYIKLIKFHVHNKDLELALSVLDLMKENRQRRTLYIYKLLISGFAYQGDINKTFLMYKNMLQEGIKPSVRVYSSLINCCAEAKNKTEALEALQFLREHMYRKNIMLNEFHYSSLIKAYSWHREFSSALEIADEAFSMKKMDKITYATIFHAAIGNKESGLTYALMLWHKRKICVPKPNVILYNLLLKAIKSTNFGPLEQNYLSVKGLKETKIQISEDATSDLLNSPPILSSSVISMYGSSMPNENNLCKIDETKDMLCLSDHLNNTLCKNRLILFGGIQGILNKMENDKVQPDLRTYTLLLELSPPTKSAEMLLLKYLKENNITPDVWFFNILIKRRSLRKNYIDAKAVLNELQTYNLKPNTETFEALAVGCIRHKDGIELLQQIDAIGYGIHKKIFEILILIACTHKNVYYLSDLLHHTLKHLSEPSTQIKNMLIEFDKKLHRLVTDKDNRHYKDIEKITTDYNTFKINFEKWKQFYNKRSANNLF